MTYEEFIKILQFYIDKNGSNGTIVLPTLGDESNFKLRILPKRKDYPYEVELENSSGIKRSFTAIDYYEIRRHFMTLSASARYFGKNYTQYYFKCNLSTQLAPLVPAIFKFLTVNNHPIF